MSAIKDIKELKDVVLEKSEKGFVSFLLTMVQYALIISLGYMIFNFNESLVMFNNNKSTYILAVLANLCLIYFTNRATRLNDQKHTVDLYIKGKRQAEEIEKKKHDELVERRIKNNPKINEILKDVLINLDADRVTVCEMHNGTNNLAGVPFLFADMAYFANAHDVEDISDEYKNVNLSRLPFVANHFDEGIFLKTVEEIEEEDQRFAMKLRIGKTKFFAGMVIRGVKYPIGFLSVTYTEGSAIPSKTEIIAEMNKAAQIISSLLDNNIE